MLRRRILLALPAVLVMSACAAPTALVMSDAALNPEPGAPVVTVTVTASDDGAVLSGAEVTAGSAQLVADENGQVEVEWRDEPIQLVVAAPGFLAGSQTISTYPEATEGALSLALDPRVLHGKVVGPDGTGLPATTVTLNGVTTRTEEDGSFAMPRALAGDVAAERPAWEPASTPWDGETETVEVAMEPRTIRGLRVSGDKAADPEVWSELLDLVDGTGVNALIIDTKDETGWVFHESSVELVEEIGALNNGHLYDVEQLIADMDAHGLYKITRITTFQDNFLAQAQPDIAIRDEVNGGLWTNDRGIHWLDATDRNAWEYPLDLAVEACELGFDEIQFDYIRFPSDGDVATADTDGDYAEPNRIATVRAFLREAYSRLNPMGCAVAADIFAITLTSDWDEGIGQKPEPLSQTVDVLSPMVYTYTYGRGWGGFDDPNEHAAEIVAMALDAGIDKDRGFAIYRPWIQTWQLNAEEINTVQGEVEQRGLGWMIWSANTLYDNSFLPAG
ncbi:MAG: putative glycoside hydrolase [Acidimicrobiia bacterium]